MTGLGRPARLLLVMSLGLAAGCGHGRLAGLARSECTKGGPAVPMRSLGHDAEPFRLERFASSEETRGQTPPRRYVYRFEREPSGTTETLRAITMEHQGKVLVVGDRGTALVRDPAAGWTREATGTEEGLHAIVRAPFRPDGPVDEKREKQAPYVVVGAHGTALVRTADGRWSAESTGIQEDLFGLLHLGTSTLAVGARGAMVQRLHQGGWRRVATRTTSDLFAVGSCSPHVCAVGAGGTVVDCGPGEGEGELVCIPRSLKLSGDLRVISDEATLFGQGVLLGPARTPDDRWSPPPMWQPWSAAATVPEDEIRAAWNNHWMGASEQLAAGRGGVLWFLARYGRAKPFERVVAPFGVDFHGVAFELVDGFLVGDRGTIVHLSVEGVDLPVICLE